MSRYGWSPDVPDMRDRRYSVAHPITLPPVVDMRSLMPPVYDQGQLGSCTANAIAAAIQYERRRQKFADDFVPSRLFIYFNERSMEGTIASDAGAQIRDGIKSIAALGDCQESMWPYDATQFTAKPDPACYSSALKYKALDYWRVPRALSQMKGCLAAGFPFVFGFSVYESFESGPVAQTGVVPMPAPNEQMLGGHAVMAVGYDDSKQCFIVRNSWGEGWGDHGNFYLPYQYFLDENLSDDFWCIKAEAA